MRRLLKFAAVGLGAVLGLAVVVLAGAFLYLRSSLPESEGEMRMAGPAAQITLARDVDGIPYITAESERDAAFALGFAHAGDRLFQMELTRRLGAGRLAEIVGQRGLVSDRFMRTLGLYALAEGNYQRLPPPLRAVFDAYAEGVNAYVAHHSGALAPELAVMGLIGVRFEPWRPADSLVWGRLMGMSLTHGWRDQLLHARLLQRLPAEQIRLLLDHQPDGPEVPLAEIADPALLERLLAAIPEAARPRLASNIWILAGTRTATGKPLLANDPHLGFQLPNLWYLARIATPETTLVGSTVPGVPLMVLGHNGRIAWGMTTTSGDTSDVFAEETLPDDANAYRTPDGTKRFSVREEVIHVRGGGEEHLRVRVSRHGPIISDLAARAGEPRGAAIALAHPVLAEDDHSVEAIYRLNHAGTWEEFRASMALFDAPEQNVGYAGPDGIGLIVAGRVPVRRDVRPWQAADGAGPGGDWIGWLAFDELPMAQNPSSGRIVNANNAVVDASYPHYLGRDFDAPYRARRIAAMLEKSERVSTADMARLQMDATSTMALDVLPLMLSVVERTPATAGILDRLARWDGGLARDRSEPLIFTAWWRRLLRRLYAEALGEFADEVTPLPAVVKRTLAGTTPWCGGQAPPERASCGRLAAQALAEAIAELGTAHGEDQEDWHWGDAHAARFVHPILGRLPVIGGFFRFHIATSGDNWTVNRGTTRLNDPNDPYGHVHGAGVRAVYDLADLDRSLFSMALGESGNPFSPHFADMLTRWRNGVPVTIGRGPRQPAAVLRLIPSSQ
ncbi:MAG: penicillin acylase family protein [Proteobacteria bacterium]|nr:penicillin acylase family protein [Pseudomonadota bacterium]MBI3499883.1 penicillin acylase family protein [Pseudomonadota bacterium]